MFHAYHESGQVMIEVSDDGKGISSDMIATKAVEKGIPVISEIEFASRYTDAKIIALTGSNGKTTTTMLTYHILKEAGLNVGMAGNIGDSFAKQVAADVTLSLSKNQHQQKYYVLELSSFQLDGIVDFKPLVSLILNAIPKLKTDTIIPIIKTI